MKLLALSTALVAFSAFSVAAQEAPVDDGLYWRVGAGVNFLSDWRQDLEAAPGLTTCLAIGCNPDGLATSHGNGLVAGGALGFDYADGIRTELEYRYALTDVSLVTPSESGIDLAPLTMEGETTAHIVMGNFYFDFTNESAFTPYIGGGVGGVFVTAIKGDRDAALAYQARAGVSLSLGPKFYLDTEYVYTRSQNLDFDGSPVPDYVAGGERYEASTIMASFRKQF